MTLTPDELAAIYHEANGLTTNQLAPITTARVFNAMLAVEAHARQQHAEEIANLDRDELIRIAKDAGFEASWIYKIPRLPDFLERFAAMLETPQRLREIDRALADVDYSGPYENGIYALKAQVERLRDSLIKVKKAKVLRDIYPKHSGPSYMQIIDAALAQETGK